MMTTAVKGYAGEIPVYCAFDKIVDIKELRENPRNPNKHPEKQINLLSTIIQRQGWRQPIKVSTTSGYIVSGHGRYQAALLIGAECVPVDYQSYATEADETADLLADNRIAELSDMDNKMLAEIFSDVNSGEIDAILTGYETADIENILADVTDLDIDDFFNENETPQDKAPHDNDEIICPNCGVAVRL